MIRIPTIGPHARWLAPALLLSIPGVGSTGYPAEEHHASVVSAGAVSWSQRVWTAEDGLPQNSVTAIAQTEDGYLWLGTFGGLVRFDGRAFEVFDIARTPELGSNHITALEVDRDDRLWIGTVGKGVCRLEAGRLQSFPPERGAPEGAIRGIAEDDDGVIWIAGSTIVRYADGRFEPHSGRAARTLLQRDGRVWATRWTQPDIAELSGGEERKSVGDLIGIDAPHHRFGDVVALVRDRRGLEWLAGTRGLFRVGTGAAVERVLGRELGEPRSLFEDREGNLWMGTEGRGLVRLRRDPFVHLHRKDLRLGGTLVVAPHLDDGLWLLATNLRFVFRLRGDTLTRVHELPLAHFKQAVATEDGALWVGGHDQVVRLAGGSVREHSVGHHVSTLALSRDGGVWVGGPGRLTRIDGELRQTLVTDDLPDEAILSIRETLPGTVWAGGTSWVARIEGTRADVFTSADGAPLGAVRSIHADAEGGIWFGAYGSGITRYDGERFARCTVREGLPDNAICSLLADGRGNVWVGSNRGVFRIAERELIRLAAGHTDRVRTTRLPTPEGDGRTAARDAGGRLWFPTIHGLVGIDPAAVEPLEPPLPVIIERVTAGPRELDAGAPELTLGERDFTIRYTSPSFAAADDLLFRYRLVGHDETWHETSALSATYLRVPPGDYSFEVTAEEVSGATSPSPTRLALTVPPYVYETGWFRAVVALTVIALGAGLYRARVRRLKHQRERLHEEVLQRRASEAALKDLGQRLVRAQEEERRRIARELHDDFAQRLAAVVIDTSVVARGSEGPTDERLNDVTERVRAISDDVHRLSRTLHPSALEELGLTRALESECREFSRRTGIAAQVLPDELPPGVPKEHELTLYRVAQEALRNVEKHARAPSVRVAVRCEDGDIALVVEDTGRGFVTNGELSGLGLCSMRERVTSLGGSLAVEGRPGQGTRIEARVRAGDVER